MTRVYLCGPVIGDKDYLQKFLDAEYAIKSCFGDMAVINPARIAAMLSDECGIKYNEYVNIFFTLIDYADMVFMLEGWESNRRAMMEREYAQIQFKQVVNMCDIF